MESINSDMQTHSAEPAEDCRTEITESKSSRYDDPFYNDIFGAFEGPPDLARRHKEYFAEIMDAKYRRRSK